MKMRDLSVLAGFLMMCAGAAPALAGVAPYIRLDYGGNQLRMTGENGDIQRSQTSFQTSGYPAAFQAIGSGYGPAVSAGLWILPGFRLGATYSYLRAVRNNRLDVPGVISYADGLDLRMNEIGAEAAVRLTRLAGLTVGASAGGGRGERIERRSSEVTDFKTSLDETACRTRMTLGGFVGIDQTNPAGVAGFIRVGYQYRDMGHMSGHSNSAVTLPGGTTRSTGTVTTPEMDFSGFYVRVGVGFDLVR